VWNIKELENYPNCTVKIYNRWGHLIFESAGYETPWDGSFGGSPLPSGSYFYVIELGPGSLAPLTGSVTIIKG
jgi:gliding motility-associated-like protein